MISKITKLRFTSLSQILYGGCFLFLIAPVFFFTIGLLLAIVFGTIPLTQALAMTIVPIIFFPLVWHIGTLAMQQFNKAAEAHEEIDVIHQKMEAHAGSISVSEASLAGELTEVQSADGGLEVAFDFEGDAQEASPTHALNQSIKDHR